MAALPALLVANLPIPMSLNLGISASTLEPVTQSAADPAALVTVSTILLIVPWSFTASSSFCHIWVVVRGVFASSSAHISSRVAMIIIPFVL